MSLCNGLFLRHTWKIHWLCRANHPHDARKGCPHIWECQVCSEIGYSIPKESDEDLQLQAEDV